MLTGIVHRKIFYSWLQILIFSGLTIYHLSNISPAIVGDTPSYTTLYTSRPPVYPIFFWLFHLFGKYQYVAVMWAQSIISFSALLYARKWLHKHLGISEVLTFFILSFCIVQIFFHFELLQSICSEGLSFPLFIITFLLLVDCFKTCNLRKICYLSACTGLLILTRIQFIYFYPLLGILVIWYFWRKIPIKHTFITLMIVLFSILITAEANRTFHVLFPGQTGDMSPGEYLLFNALYLSDSNFVKYIDKVDDQIIYAKIVKQLEEHQLTKKSAPPVLGKPIALTRAYVHYNAAYIQIVRSYYKIVNGMPRDQVIAIATNISKAIYLHSIKDNLIFYVGKIVTFFGDISFFTVFALILLVGALRSLSDRAWNPDYCQIFIIISFLTILANVAFVSIFEALETRYLYYCYFLILCLGALLNEKVFLQTGR